MLSRHLAPQWAQLCLHRLAISPMSRSIVLDVYRTFSPMVMSFAKPDSRLRTVFAISILACGSLYVMCLTHHYRSRREYVLSSTEHS